MSDFIIRHINSLIPFLLGIGFLAIGLRLTLSGSNGRRQLQCGAALVLVALWGFGRASGTQAAAGLPWTALSEPGRFSVMLPPDRTLSQSDDPTPFGPARTHKWKAAENEPVSYIFRYTDMPAGGEYPDPQAALDAMAKALNGIPGSRLTGSRPLTVGGFPGREVDGLSGGTELRGHLFVAGARVYALIRTSPKGLAPGSDPFFTSFTLGAP